MECCRRQNSTDGNRRTRYLPGIQCRAGPSLPRRFGTCAGARAAGYFAAFREARSRNDTRGRAEIMSLMSDLNQKALGRGVPLSVHLDVTYRCNERCEHCYLDHDGDGEMNTAEIKTLLDQLAAAGVFFLTISGGEPLVRPDCFEIIEHARKLRFNVKFKTNAVLIREKQAKRLRELNVEQVQISVYSHRAEVHDGISKVP